MKKQETKEKQKNLGAGLSGLVFAGCMFIGIGIGMIYGEKRIGGAIGMGVGFISMAIFWAYYRDK